MAANEVTVAAVGRVAKIGDLYDVRTDQFLNISLMKEKLPASIIQTRDVHTSPYSVHYANMDTLKEKLDFLDIQNELRISVLCGLIEVDGSAKFLNYKKSNGESAQATLSYRFFTKLDGVTMDEVIQELVSKDILKKTNATHVVIEIKWGRGR